MLPSSKKFINPNLFFLLENEQIIAWDYKNHQQFNLEKEYFFRLLEASNSEGLRDKNHIDQELHDGQLLIDEQPQIEWGWDNLSKIFHFGTQNIPIAHRVGSQEEYINDYIQFCDEIPEEQPRTVADNNEIFVLPKPNLSLLNKKDFWSVILNRKTCRSFDGSPIELDVLSTLLYTCFGEIHGSWKELDELGLKESGIRKSSPSGGALHPSEAYVVVLRVNDLLPGIYHYRSHEHVLSLVSHENLQDKIGILLCGQHFAESLSIGIFISCRFNKSWRKYPHSRAYRIALLDIGHLSQTFQLTATALGLHPWLTGIFQDDEANQLLKFDSTTEHAMFFVGAGIGDGSCLDKITKKIITDSTF